MVFEKFEGLNFDGGALLVLGKMWSGMRRFGIGCLRLLRGNILENIVGFWKC